MMLRRHVRLLLCVLVVGLALTAWGQGVVAGRAGVVVDADADQVLRRMGEYTVYD